MGASIGLVCAGAQNDKVTVHLIKSRLIMHDTLRYQKLDVVINEKHYVLESTPPCGGVLLTGDYNAQLIADKHPRAYDAWQVYRFQFNDGRTREYLVVEVE